MRSPILCCARSPQKRRSTRNVKRKTYIDDFHLSGDEEETVVDVVSGGGDVTFQQPIPFYVENPNEDDAVIVEKILSYRGVNKNEHSTDEAQNQGIEQYYVKYKNFSYLHCEWKTVEELEKDKRIHQKLKRFWAKRATVNVFDQFDDEPFNPDYVEVDRVLDISTQTDPNNGQPVTHYLVKWQQLPYEDSTWELEEDIDTSKLEQYHYFKQPPEPEDREPKPRPEQEAWHQLDPNVTYKNDNKLREYQMEGVNWLLFNWYNRRNCILADEMGLGKTVQSITFLKAIQEQGILGPFLIIAPLSTIGNWQREFETWTNINVVVYHGR
ncbi:CHD9 [Branchiostoma lanceolatum]|uniref:CHD9 protein n=1 Tax=Branchiostoma lanceolatum TaxID=7740 RepID=A0A8S4MNU8_BRALA|nr:CHD9 [Branchiostoma lanceolatum]